MALSQPPCQLAEVAAILAHRVLQDLRLPTQLREVRIPTCGRPPTAKGVFLDKANTSSVSTWSSGWHSSAPLPPRSNVNSKESARQTSDDESSEDESLEDESLEGESSDDESSEDESSDDEAPRRNKPGVISVSSSWLTEKEGPRRFAANGKEIARKSTGGKAPCRQLGGPAAEQIALERGASQNEME